MYVAKGRLLLKFTENEKNTEGPCIVKKFTLTWPKLIAANDIQSILYNESMYSVLSSGYSAFANNPTTLYGDNFDNGCKEVRE